MTREWSFFCFARERYQILLNRRAGKPKPWTKDPILLQYRFCNVFREDDTTTQWIRMYLRGPMSHSDQIVFVMAVARFFNRVETLELIKTLLYYPESHELWDEVRERLAGVRPLITGAYMIKSPAMKTKLEGLIEILEPLRQRSRMFHSRKTLESAHEVLLDFPYIGGFMAYEIVTDLRHTHLLCNAPDINTWAYPGPGAKRGLCRYTGNDIKMAKQLDSKRNQKEVQERMQGILEKSRNHWPRSWPTWEMREVEHTLCEFDKYERVRLGEGTPKQRYQGEAP